jgi:hypothetical protein
MRSLFALVSQRLRAICDPAQELTSRTQPSALAHIHAQSIVARNGVGLEESRRIASFVTHRRERPLFHGSLRM